MSLHLRSFARNDTSHHITDESGIIVVSDKNTLTIFGMYTDLNLRDKFDCTHHIIVRIHGK